MTQSVTPNQLAQGTEPLRARAEELAQALIRAAEAVGGPGPGGARRPPLDAWSAARGEVAELLGAAGRPWPGTAGFAEPAALAGELAAEELHRLREQRDGLRTLPAKAAPDAPHLGPPHESLTLLDQRIPTLTTPPRPRPRLPRRPPFLNPLPSRSLFTNPNPNPNPSPLPFARPGPGTGRRAPGRGRGRGAAAAARLAARRLRRGRGRPRPARVLAGPRPPRRTPRP